MVMVLVSIIRSMEYSDLRSAESTVDALLDVEITYVLKGALKSRAEPRLSSSAWSASSRGRYPPWVR